MLFAAASVGALARAQSGGATPTTVVRTVAPNEEPLAPPPPRATVGGLCSLDASSLVRFAADPERAHRLKATYAFPARTRWWFGLAEAEPSARLLRFEYGDALFAVAPGQGRSTRLAGAERDEARMQLEMRRALFLWPDGCAWSRTGRVARASLGALGSLEAHFASDDAPRPERLAFLPPAAPDATSAPAPIDEYRAITWADVGTNGRAWPATFALWHAGTHVWDETVEAVDTRTRWIDSFFVPPDRREGARGNPTEVGAVRAMDLPEQRVRRMALAAGATWDTARAECTRLAAETSAELAPHGLALEARATIEVDTDVRPVAVLLRLAPSAKPLPAALAPAWTIVPERPALATFTNGLAALDASRWRLLVDGLPAESKPGVPYVRFDPAAPTGLALLVVPLLAVEPAPAK